MNNIEIAKKYLRLARPDDTALHTDELLLASIAESNIAIAEMLELWQKTRQ